MNFLRDLRRAARTLRHSLAASAVAVLALALGIGVNASSFITIESMVLHPLPYPRLDRIVTLWETLPKVRTAEVPLSPADFTDINNQSHSFAAVAAYRGWDVSLTATGVPERIQAALVSSDFFGVLGMQPELGRTFANDANQHQRVVVVSDAFWKNRLAGSRAAVGKPISLNGAAYTVIGVMPDSFDLPLLNQIWAPLVLDPAQQHDREHHDLSALALLKANVSPEQARAELAAIASRLAKQYPRTNGDRGLLADPIRDMAERVTGRFLLMLFGAAGFVLLLACANIGNLLLARATNREREFAVRTALGAGRLQIAREMVAESVLLSLAAAVIGLLLASWNVAYAKISIPADAFRHVPGLRHMHVDATVLLFTLGVSLLAGLLCSLPAIAQVIHRRMRADLTTVMRGHSSAQTANPARNRLRTGLIVFELAFALVLLVGAGLMVKTFNRLLYLNQGFDPNNLLTMQVSLPAPGYHDPAQIQSFYKRVLERFQTLRGATASALVSRLGPADNFAIEGQPEPRAGDPRPAIRSVSAHYFEAMRIPLIEGRAISASDGPASPRVVVLSEDVARHYWPDSDPIGRRVRLDAHSGWLTVVGVSGKVIDDWFMNQPAPKAYVSYAQFPSPGAMFLLRTTGDPAATAPAALRNIRREDREVPVFDVKSMQQSMYEERSGIQAAARTMASFAVIALLLAVTGIYAVISYFVAARTHDIGVHMALGAKRSDVLKMTMKQSMRFIVAGLAFGIPLALLLSRLMSHAIFNVVVLDSSTFVIFAAVLVASGLLASYLPGRRATRIDPMAALRNE
jgi:putative ABC transport system permease protein